MKLDSNNHSVFLLYYHLVLVVKYRRKVFSDQMSQYAKDIFVRIGSSYNITLEEWNHDQDHVHIMFRAHPNTELSKFINAYKSASSRLIKKDFPEVRRKLWKEMFCNGCHIGHRNGSGKTACCKRMAGRNSRKKNRKIAGSDSS